MFIDEFGQHDFKTDEEALSYIDNKPGESLKPNEWRFLELIIHKKNTKQVEERLAYLRTIPSRKRTKTNKAEIVLLLRYLRLEAIFKDIEKDKKGFLCCC